VINVDAAYKSLTGESAIGAVARDGQGSTIAVTRRTINRCQDAEESEARAILARLQLGIELGLHEPIVMSDCTAAVNASRSPVPNLSKLWSVYKDISNVALPLLGCLVQYTSRKFNCFAHNLAQ
jgi:ribonuclease HI